MRIKNLVKLALCFCISLHSIAALAGPDVTNGNFWFDQCSPQKSPAERGYCYTYIIGVLDGAVSQAALTKTNITTCRPDGVSTEQLADVFYEFLKKNPEIRHLDPGVLLISSIMRAFPCSKRPPITSFDKK